MSDSLAILVNEPIVLLDFLLTKADLIDEVGTRIWPEYNEPPEAAHYKPSQGGAITFKRRGGEIDYTSQMLTSSWQFKCYGALPRNDSETERGNANRLYRLLVAALHDQSGLGIWRATMEVPGQTLREPSTGWTFVLCFFETRIRSGLGL